MQLFDYAWSKLGGKKIINAKSARGGNCVILSALNASLNPDFLLHLLGKFSPEEKSEFFYNQRNIFGLNAAESLILRRPDYDRILIERADFSQEQITKIRRVAASRAFLSYAYSNDGFFMDHRLVCDIQKLLLQRSKDESDQKFLDALQIIRDGKLVQIGDKKVKVKNLKYSNHDAFAIIICDLDDKPQFISYVDSYAPLQKELEEEYSFGECRFEVREQYQNLKVLEEKIEKLFKDSKLYNQPLLLNAALAEIASSEVSQSVPTKKQSRSKINCSYKSSNIAMRTLAQMMHPEMTYELGEDGKPRGNLYDDYKKFRRKITDLAMLNLREQLLTSADNGDEFDKSVYEPIVLDLEAMYEKALAKKDQPRIHLIDVVLQDVADHKIKLLTQSLTVTSLQQPKSSEKHL